MMLKRIYLPVLILFVCIGAGRAQVSVREPSVYFPVADTLNIREEIKAAKAIAVSDPVHAARRFDLILQQSLHAGYSYGITVSAIESGNIKVQQGDYETALSFYAKALTACDSATRPLFAALIHNLIGNVCNLGARYQQASYYYYKAATLAEMYPARQLPPSYAYSNLATVLAQLKQYDKALLYGTKALTYAVQHKDTLLHSTQLMNIGTINYELKNYKAAIFYLDSSVRIARRAGLTANQHKALVNKAAVYMAQEDPAKALQSLLLAAALEEDYPVAFNEHNVTLSAIGDAYLQLKQYDKAQAYFSLAWTGGATLPKERLFLLEKLSELAKARGRHEDALALRKDYEQLKDSLSNQDITLQVHELETRYRTAEKDKELALKQARISVQEKQITQKNLWLGIAALVCILLLLAATAAYFYILQKNKITARNRQIETLKARLEGEEDERQRLAQELHDGIGSQLAGAKSYLLALGNVNPELKEHAYFRKVSQALNETAADLRQVAHNLMPHVLGTTGITTAVKEYCKDLNLRTGLEIEFHAYGDFSFIDAVLSLNIYRMVQELLHNVAKHAEATEAIVLLNERPYEISIIVEDNGKGITAEAKGTSGIGLANMQQRVAMLSGSIQIESSAPGGTIISIFLPKDVQTTSVASGSRLL